jgi:hypothetical protein
MSATPAWRRAVNRLCFQATNQPSAWAGGGGAWMFHSFLRTILKVLAASLVVGVALDHFGITPDHLMQQIGLSRDRVEELARQALNWALPNLLLGSLIIVPVWFLIYLFRPPGRSSD